MQHVVRGGVRIAVVGRGAERERRRREQHGRLSDGTATYQKLQTARSELADKILVVTIAVIFETQVASQVDCSGRILHRQADISNYWYIDGGSEIERPLVDHIQAEREARIILHVECRIEDVAQVEAEAEVKAAKCVDGNGTTCGDVERAANPQQGFNRFGSTRIGGHVLQIQFELLCSLEMLFKLEF